MALLDRLTDYLKKQTEARHDTERCLQKVRCESVPVSPYFQDFGALIAFTFTEIKIWLRKKTFLSNKIAVDGV